MQITTLTVHGFRSLANVGPLPIRKPTILAGHNDSGKTACMDALAFLLGSYQFREEDRTYLTRPVSVAVVEEPDHDPIERRVSSTWVEGTFVLSNVEQALLGLSEIAQIRRITRAPGQSALELLSLVAADTRLRDLETKTVLQLKELASAYSVGPGTDSPRKHDWINALRAHAASLASISDWTPASAELAKCLPKLLRFGDAGSAELAVKSALSGRYKHHLEDRDLRDQVTTLETELRTRVKSDAEGLVAHIKARCPELVLVEVEPEVSFTHGLRATRLRLAQVDGEEVSIAAAGAGRARRISLAIWEWTSEIIQRDADSDGSAEGLSDVLIAYDEPDTHLDYLQQRRVMKLIREQCSVRGIAMMIATHSMNLIDGAAMEDIIHLRLAEGRTSMELLLSDSSSLRNQEYLTEIAIALGLRNTILLHERFFVGVEGPSEQQAFPALFKLSTGRSLQSAGIVIVGCNNNDGALIFAGHLAKTGRQVALVVDADSRRNKYFSDASLIRAGLDPAKHLYLVGGVDRELEYTFSNEQWVQVANDAWPRTDGQKWDESHVENLRSNQKFSSDLHELFKSESNTGPSGKPAMVFELVRTLKSPTEVPQELADIFIQLEKLAALDD